VLDVTCMGDGLSEVLRVWNESAPYWEKHTRAIQAMFKPISKAMIADARISAGDVVLDVAAGIGDPTFDIARVCGPGGWIVGTDAIWGMVAAGRRRARRDNVRNTHFVQCRADALPFRAETFDAATCRLGVMFFFEPVHDLRQILSALKPGGRLSLAVWGASQFNPFFSILPPILQRYVPIPPTSPDAPGAFRFAEPGKLVRLLEAAGASQVQERAIDFQIEADVSLKDFWTLRSEMSDTLRERAKQLTPAQLELVKRDVQVECKPYFAADQMSFPAQCLIVSAVKPVTAATPIPKEGTPDAAGALTRPRVPSRKVCAALLFGARRRKICTVA
jgi:SAM-dependent methyltransferase